MKKRYFNAKAKKNMEVLKFAPETPENPKNSPPKKILTFFGCS